MSELDSNPVVKNILSVEPIPAMCKFPAFAGLVASCVRAQVGAAAWQGTEQTDAGHDFTAKDVR